MKLLFLLAAGFLAGIIGEELPYEGAQFISTVPATNEQLEALNNLEHNGLYVDFFERSDFPGKTQSFIVMKEDVEAVKEHLRGAGLELKVVVSNVQRIVQQEDALNAFIHSATPYHFGQLDTYNFAKYHRFDAIQDFMKTLSDQAKDISEIFSIGQSTEGRPLNVIRIGKPNGQKKPAFYLHCNTHAREFITAGTCVYIINKLITEYQNGNAQLQKYVTDMDWYILPVHNPDGYEYAHTKYRYWRKTRSGPHGKGILKAMGVDPNRNWDTHFGGAGASKIPRMSNYHGPHAHSEPEVQAVAKFVMDHKDTIKAFVGVHSFSQLWLIPYSHEKNTQPSDGDQLNRISDQVVAAIKSVDKKVYKPGTAANILYRVTGGSFDWAKEKAGIKWCFSPESRPKTSIGPFGFNPNPKEIIGNAEEQFAGFRVIADQILTDRANGVEY